MRPLFILSAVFLMFFSSSLPADESECCPDIEETLPPLPTPSCIIVENPECCPPACGWFRSLCGVPVGFAAYGAALYWRPTYEGVQYATRNPGAAFSSQTVYVTPESRWGYRYGAQLEFCCDFFVESNFTFFRQGSRSSIAANDQIFPVFAPFVTDLFDSANALITSKYQAVDIFGGYRWAEHCLWDSHFFAGARYVRFKEKESYQYLEPGGTIPFAPAFQRYTFTGWGPRLGADFSLHPLRRSCCDFLIVKGHVAAMAAMGSRTNLMESLATGGIFPQGNLEFPDRFVTLMAADLRLELACAVCICKINFLVKGGYELNYYFNGRRRIEATNTFGFAPRSSGGIGYGGPYIELSGGF